LLKFLFPVFAKQQFIEQMASQLFSKALIRAPSMAALAGSGRSIFIQRAMSSAPTPMRRGPATIAEQYKSPPVQDKSMLFHPTTWVKYWELTPVVFAVGFAAAICGSYIIYAFMKEEIHINPLNKNAPYEEYHHDHRTHLLYPHGPRQSKVPAEIVELKKQLGPYRAY